MTEEQATKILGVFSAAHPKVTLTPAMVDIWFQAALATTKFSDGMALALDLVATDPQFPTPASFNAAKRVRKDRERMQDQKDPEPMVEIPPAEAHRQIDNWREKLGYPRRHGNQS